MKVKMLADASKFDAALKAIGFGEQDLLDIKGAGQYVMINGMRQRVPIATSATQNSIRGHLVESSSERVVDDVGPETLYAPYLEFGTGEFAENGQGRKGGWFYKDAKGWHFTFGMRAQPFIRPTISEDKNKILTAISMAFGALVEKRWPR